MPNITKIDLIVQYNEKRALSKTLYFYFSGLFIAILTSVIHFVVDNKKLPMFISDWCNVIINYTSNYAEDAGLALLMTFLGVSAGLIVGVAVENVAMGILPRFISMNKGIQYVLNTSIGLLGFQTVALLKHYGVLSGLLIIITLSAISLQLYSSALGSEIYNQDIKNISKSIDNANMIINKLENGGKVWWGFTSVLKWNAVFSLFFTLGHCIIYIILLLLHSSWLIVRGDPGFTINIFLSAFMYFAFCLTVILFFNWRCVLHQLYVQIFSVQRRWIILALFSQLCCLFFYVLSIPALDLVVYLLYLVYGFLAFAVNDFLLCNHRFFAESKCKELIKIREGYEIILAQKEMRRSNNDV